MIFITGPVLLLELLRLLHLYLPVLLLVLLLLVLPYLLEFPKE
jgi:hypothetical protein